uniref:Uncharacterized protein n=1 Tax=Calcidiscus leptoporus TaxID=127549 RepID=A0A7S0P5Z9_9EUKA|mmetsp:Transcript_7625/g.17827  ORF Transcript_7625/g.17827 Transcript_7625/m.17827 type:complete len:291 (+) Transcript_7625:186-1058(+)
MREWRQYLIDTADTKPTTSAMDSAVGGLAGGGRTSDGGRPPIGGGGSCATSGAARGHSKKSTVGGIEGFGNVAVQKAREASVASVRATLLQSLSLMEATLGWVSGCAWTNAVVASPYFAFQAFPTVPGCIKNGGSALLLTCCGVGWLVASGSGSATRMDDRQRGKREEVERYFATNAMGFFVGWSWLVFLRSLSTQFARVGMLAGEASALIGEVLCMAVLAPVLVLALLQATEYASLAQPLRGPAGVQLMQQPHALRGSEADGAPFAMLAGPGERPRAPDGLEEVDYALR